ncbi:MAG TPA: hypothetical protein VL945_01540 [Candidatus Saccharimonadales bacterium]|nr:hypothetical protein [Candidatus Saccharimonadales bacterium]
MSSSKGLFSRRTRKLSRHIKPSEMGISKMLNSFENGSKVIIMPRSTHNRSVPHPRYKGRTAIVLERRGDAYVVEMELSKSTKRRLVVPQMHLQKA